MRQALHPGRPLDSRHAGFKSRGRQFKAAGPQRRDRGSSVLELMTAVKTRRRQVEQTVAVLINQPAALFSRSPVLAGNRQRRAHAGRLPFNHRERLARLIGDDRRHLTLEDAGFLGGDQLKRVTEKLPMIDRDARDHTGERTFDHVRGIEPAAEPDFEQQHIGRIARKQKKCRGGFNLEHGDRCVAIFGLTLGERFGQFGIADELAASLPSKAKALVEPDQIGRRIDVHAFAGGFEHRPHEGDRRTFAIGAGNVDQGRQAPFWIIESRKQSLDAAKRQVDALGMQRKQPRQDRVNGAGASLRSAHAEAGSGAGKLSSCCGATAGALVSSRHRLEIVARRSRRCTTISTMP